MLEALIRTKEGRAGKNKGDVIVVKLAGSVWGSEEVKVHQLVKWEDAELEAELTKRKKAGEKNPQIITPYAVYENTPHDFIDPETGKKIKEEKPTLILQSKKFIDVDTLPNAQDIKDPTKVVPIIDIIEVTILER